MTALLLAICHLELYYIYIYKAAFYAEITSTKVNHSISKTENHLRLMNVSTACQEMSYMLQNVADARRFTLAKRATNLIPDLPLIANRESWMPKYKRSRQTSTSEFAGRTITKSSRLNG